MQWVLRYAFLFAGMAIASAIDLADGPISDRGYLVQILYYGGLAALLLFAALFRITRRSSP